MSHKPHICFVAPEIYPILSRDRSIRVAGGAEVQQSFLARELQRAGYPVTVLTNNFGQPDECWVDGIRVIKIVRENSYNIPIVRYFHPRLTAIWKAMAKANADIYYQRCAGAPTGVVGAFTRAYKRKFIYAAANDNDVMPGEKNIIQSWRDRQLFTYGLKRASCVVVQNTLQRDRYQEWMKKEATWIKSCYAPPANARNNPQGVVLWVGMMRFGKRPHLLLDLAERLPSLQFKLIGGSSSGGDANGYYKDMQERAQKLPNVEFLGFVPYADIEQHFDEARVFVNTSDVEGFPNTFLQAWARAVPSISFVDCGAKNESGEAIGLSVSSLDEMAATIEHMMHNDEEWLTQGARCKAYFEKHHAVEQVIASYEKLIDKLELKSAL